MRKSRYGVKYFFRAWSNVHGCFDYDLWHPGKQTIEFRWDAYYNLYQGYAHKGFICVWKVKPKKKTNDMNSERIGNATITKDCVCQRSLHEVQNYPRAGIEIKRLYIGQRVYFDREWSNFYGTYARVVKPNDAWHFYDIHVDCVQLD